MHSAVEFKYHCNRSPTRRHEKRSGKRLLWRTSLRDTITATSIYQQKTLGTKLRHPPKCINCLRCDMSRIQLQETILHNCQEPFEDTIVFLCFSPKWKYRNLYLSSIIKYVLGSGAKTLKNTIQNGTYRTGRNIWKPLYKKRKQMHDTCIKFHPRP